MGQCLRRLRFPLHREELHNSTERHAIGSQTKHNRLTASVLRENETWQTESDNAFRESQMDRIQKE